MLKSSYGRKERDEPIQFIRHIYMQMSQKKHPYSCFKQTKMPFVFKNWEQEDKTIPVGGVPVGGERL
jgi:hypothetical protein